MRTHIAKALQSRCKAIRNAVKSYNAAALLMDPPRSTLDWSRVSHYSFLEEFQLLHGSRQDIQDKRWAELAVRETMKQDLRIKRAKEEIVRCNVEIQRLHTAIRDEHRAFLHLLNSLKEQGSIIYGAVREYVSLRQQVNFQILARLEKIYSLPGFTGDHTAGVRKGTTSPPSDFDSTTVQNGQVAASAELEIDEENSTPSDYIDDVDEETLGDIGGLVDYIAELPLKE